MPGHVAHSLHQRPRTAAIDMPAWLLQRRPQVECLAGIAAVVMDRHHAAECGAGQLGEERRRLLRARQVVELELGRSRRLQMPRHRQDRGDADAAGDERVAGRARGQREVVSRRGHPQRITHLDAVDQRDRAAAPGILALDGDVVVVALCRVVAQRILAHEPARHRDLDVRTGRERRQIRAISRAQLEQVDAGRNRLRAHDAEGRQRGLVGGIIHCGGWLPNRRGRIVPMAGQKYLRLLI